MKKILSFLFIIIFLLGLTSFFSQKTWATDCVGGSTGQCLSADTNSSCFSTGRSITNYFGDIEYRLASGDKSRVDTQLRTFFASNGAADYLLDAYNDQEYQAGQSLTIAMKNWMGKCLDTSGMNSASCADRFIAALVYSGSHDRFAGNSGHNWRCGTASLNLTCLTGGSLQCSFWTSIYPISCSGNTPKQCGSTCVNTQTDVNNCGSCGHSCSSGKICAYGNCTCPNAKPTSCTHTCCDIEHICSSDGTSCVLPPSTDWCQIVTWGTALPITLTAGQTKTIDARQIQFRESRAIFSNFKLKSEDSKLSLTQAADKVTYSVSGNTPGTYTIDATETNTVTNQEVICGTNTVTVTTPTSTCNASNCAWGCPDTGANICNRYSTHCNGNTCVLDDDASHLQKTNTADCARWHSQCPVSSGTKPTAPTLGDNSCTGTTAILKWTFNSANTTSIKAYYCDQSKAATGGCTPNDASLNRSRWFLLINGGNNTSPLSLPGLIAGDNYKWMVSGYNANGNTDSAIGDFTCGGEVCPDHCTSDGCVHRPHFVCQSNACTKNDGCGINDTGCTDTNAGASCGVSPGDTVLSFDIGLDAIGTTGTHRNPNANSGSTKNPNTKDRILKVDILDKDEKPVLSNKTGKISYVSDTSKSNYGRFAGTVNLGKPFTTGDYRIKVGVPGYLTFELPNPETINAGDNPHVANPPPPIKLTTGDFTGDNDFGVDDWTGIMACLEKDPKTDTSCKLADLDDNGTIDIIDMNLLQGERMAKLGN